MQINNITPLSLATQVWSNATRTLSGFGNALTLTSAVQTSIAGATQVDERAAAAAPQDITIAMSVTNAGELDLWDGTNKFPCAKTAAVGFIAFAFVGTQSNVGPLINNTGAGASNYMLCGENWHQ